MKIILTAGIAVALVGCTSLGADEPVIIKTGTTLEVRLAETLNSNRNGPGDRFAATLINDLTAEGKTLAVAGSPVSGGIVAIQEDPPRMQLAFNELEAVDGMHPLAAEVVSLTPAKHSEMKDEAAKIGGGAAAGAILGGLIGGDAKGALIGAAAGAAAGTGVSLATKDTHVYLPVGTVVRLRLREPIEVQVTSEEPEDRTS